MENELNTRKVRLKKVNNIESAGALTIHAVLFDLDGTLLDYDLRTDFLPNYLAALGKYFAHDIPPDRLVKGIMIASDAIANNDGTRTNEEAFAQVFYPFVGRTRDALEPEFMKFYQDVFPTPLTAPSCYSRRYVLF